MHHATTKRSSKYNPLNVGFLTFLILLSASFGIRETVVPGNAISSNSSNTFIDSTSQNTMDSNLSPVSSSTDSATSDSTTLRAVSEIPVVDSRDLAGQDRISKDHALAPTSGSEVQVDVSAPKGPTNNSPSEVNTEVKAEKTLNSPASRVETKKELPIQVAPENPTSTEYVVHKVSAGETPSAIWKAHGAPSYGGAKAVTAWNDVGVTLKSLRPGVELKLLIKEGDIVEVVRKLPSGDVVTLTGNSKKGYESSLRKVRVVETERTVSGTIRTSFSTAATENHVPYQVIDDLVDLFSSRIEFNKDLQPGDSFIFTYKERRCGESSTLLDPGEIATASISSGGTMFAAIRHVGTDSTARYYNENGNPIGNYFLRYPLQFSRISSVFSTSRFHPVLKRQRAHNGVDFAAPIGTPVRTIADGVVVDAGYRGGAGNMVRISHGSKYSTAYLHLSKITQGLRPGVRVSRGQIIGAVGKTGLATGPHLHFSLFENGRYINPLTASLPDLAQGDQKIPKNILMAALDSMRQVGPRTIEVAAASGRAPKV